MPLPASWQPPQRIPLLPPATAAPRGAPLRHGAPSHGGSGVGHACVSQRSSRAAPRSSGGRDPPTAPAGRMQSPGGQPRTGGLPGGSRLWPAVPGPPSPAPSPGPPPPPARRGQQLPPAGSPAPPEGAAAAAAPRQPCSAPLCPPLPSRRDLQGLPLTPTPRETARPLRSRSAPFCHASKHPLSRSLCHAPPVTPTAPGAEVL